MVTHSIIPATIAHAQYIAAHVREADRVELWAAGYMTPLETMIKAMDRSEAFTGMADDTPVCMWGVVQDDILFGFGIPWMVASTHLDTHARAFLSRNKAVIVEMLSKYGILSNYVDTRNRKAIKWLQWLGFKVAEKPQPFGALQLPFHEFSIRRA